MKTLKILALVAISALFVSGCALHNKILSETCTVVGIHIGQQPSTGMYEAKLGYVRQELVVAPVSTNGVVPDLITEFRLSSMFASDGGIYSRMALGTVACSQPGATLLFSKDPSGNINTNALLKLYPPVFTVVTNKP